MNLTDPNRLSTILTFLTHCDAQHTATIERKNAITPEGIELTISYQDYEILILKLEIAATELYNHVMDTQIAAMRMQEELEAERAALRLVNEAFKK